MFSPRADLAAMDRRLRRIEGLLELVATRLEIPSDEIAQADRIKVSAEVARLAAEGSKIAAIKLLRAEQGLDLVTAKRVVDDLPSTA